MVGLFRIRRYVVQRKLVVYTLEFDERKSDKGKA